MKIYKDKNGLIYIVAGKNEPEPQVCIAKDDGTGSVRNMFGEPLDRFVYHCASVWNNTPYNSRTNCLINEDDNAYQYKLVKLRRIKKLGKKK